jgi:hypothetical protein
MTFGLGRDPGQICQEWPVIVWDFTYGGRKGVERSASGSPFVRTSICTMSTGTSSGLVPGCTRYFLPELLWDATARWGLGNAVLLSGRDQATLTPRAAPLGAGTVVV